MDARGPTGPSPLVGGGGVGVVWGSLIQIEFIAVHGRSLGNLIQLQFIIHGDGNSTELVFRSKWGFGGG